MSRKSFVNLRFGLLSRRIKAVSYGFIILADTVLVRPSVNGQELLEKKFSEYAKITGDKSSVNFYLEPVTKTRRLIRKGIDQ